MGGFLSKAINTLFEDWIDGAINFILVLLAQIGGSGIKILEMDIVVDAIIYAQGIGITLLSVVVAKEMLFRYILQESGDEVADPAKILIRVVKSVAVIISVPWIVTTIYKFGTTLAIDVAKLEGGGFGSPAGKGSLKDMLKAFAALEFLPLFILVMVISIVILMFIIVIQASIRAAELAFLAVVGCFMAVSLMNPNSEMYSSWWRQLLAISLAQASQLLLIKIGFESLQTMFKGPEEALLGFCLFFGVLIVAVKVPTILKEHIHSTGTGKMGSNSGQQISMMAVSRMAMKK
ncbi:conjugal transfer protein TrbL family protein [Exiguobacterium acetylicum]|uniref:conjugal transfer protein TrbL family protein n=1 Tax=Exiguobacterium acetylicum TaxID=41170 RepID=UPI001CA78286|nr:conjugal transfer protein TrbL family protein [Exiguobacterium acetylicum]QZY88617.1 DUF6102 family protein [Exiguobacterium acetylicum]